jgi:hypothetical protein
MYVRLKHALSALALEAVRSPGRSPASAAVTWLAAFCDAAASAVASAAGGEPGVPIAVPMATAAARAGPRGRGWSRGLQRLLDAGLLEQRDALLLLPAGFQPHFPYMSRQAHRLAEVLRRLAAARPLGGQAGALRRGAALFNGGLFFECHEYFEGIWRAAPGADKAFYQGIILVAAGFYHYEKGNRHGARVKLASGIAMLRRFLPAWRGVRLDRWLARLAPWPARIEMGQRVGVLRASEIPKIPLIR